MKNDQYIAIFSDFIFISKYIEKHYSCVICLKKFYGILPKRLRTGIMKDLQIVTLMRKYMILNASHSRQIFFILTRFLFTRDFKNWWSRLFSMLCCLYNQSATMSRKQQPKYQVPHSFSRKHKSTLFFDLLFIISENILYIKS